MCRKPHFSVMAVVLTVVAAGAMFPSASAQESSVKGDKADAAKVIHEQNIYIPYEKLRQVFEKEGRGVFLPYEKFQELWKAAREKAVVTPEHKPPVGALLGEIDNEATVAKDVVRVKGRLKIEVLAEGWNEIPLRLSDAAITSATIDDKPARLLGGAKLDYRLLVEKKGKQPEQIELLLEYAKGISRAPGQNSVSFEAPQAPVSRWRVVIPQAGVKVNISPLIAATEVPEEEKKAEGAKKTNGTKKKPADETVVLAFVGAAPVVRIDWTPKAEGATGLAAIASVQAEQQVWLSEGVTRTRTSLAYTISRAELGQLTIEVPADQKVVNVFDANVRQWSVEQAEGRQRITAQLFEPAKQSQQVTVELEKFTHLAPGDSPGANLSLPVPVVNAVGIGRQQGVVVVNVAPALRAEVTKASGLLQIDAGELPATLARGSWAFAYRYSAVPFELTLDVEKVQPRILVDSLVEAYLEPQRLSLDLLAIYTVERAGAFRLELDVPADYEIRKVYGREIAGATAAQVDSHHLEGAKKTRLVANLSRKALGRVALAVELQKDLNQPTLLTPADNQKAVDIAVPVPVAAAGSVERATGRLLIYAPESLRVNPAKTDGLRSITFQESLEGMQSIRTQKPAQVRPVLGFAFTQEPIALSLAAERRKPQVTIQQLLVARIESGVIKYEATFFYDVLYSGIKSLRIDVPADVSPDLHNQTRGVQEKVLDPQPKDLEGYVAWSFTPQSEMLGKGSINLVWEKKLGELEAGKSADINVPHLRPHGADRAWGQIVLSKAETLDIEEKGEPKNLRPIDPQQDLRTPVPGAARAFEFYDPSWTLAVTVTQYKLEEVKRTSIERAVVRMVLTPAKETSVQALYRIRSAHQRLALGLPENAVFDTSPLRINGRPVSLERGGQGEFFVPLVDSSADKPLLLELRYSLPDSGRRLDLPVFPQDPAVQKVYLCVYLPAKEALLAVSGPWNDEGGRAESPVDASGQCINDSYLVSWVREGVDVASGPPDNFQTDGTPHIYSALRPAPPPDGSLCLHTMHQDGLHALVFLVVFVGGVLLLPARGGARALAVGLLITALVLLGVFLPTLAAQILGGVLFWAIFLVLVLWIVRFFMRWRPLAFATAAGRPQSPMPPTAQPPQAPTPEASQSDQPSGPRQEGGASHE